MSAEDDLRLAWVAHGDGMPARRDALLTLAVATAGIGDGDWVDRVRAFLVKSRPNHLFAGTQPLAWILNDPRVVASVMRLRQSYPPSRVKSLVFRDAVARGPYCERGTPVEVLVDDILTPRRKAYTRKRARLGTFEKARFVPAGALAPLGAVTPQDAGVPETEASLLAFYITVLLGVAALCAVALDDAKDGKRAA